MEKLINIFSLFIVALIFNISAEAADKKNGNENIQAIVIQQFVEEAKKNDNWKIAFVTGKNEQIVFMNISPRTNPSNEIGEEIHPFDQVILIAEGNGKAILNGKISLLKTGDMIFIPQGVAHNVINLEKEKELKIISFYSNNDIPEGAVYKKRTDEKQE